MVSSVLRWWRKRAGIRSVEATPQEANPLGAEEQFRKAIEYANGEGVVQDYAQAAQWYTQAAEQNHSPAQLKLAMLYGRGLGVPQDKAKSLLWLTRAANLGNAAAQYLLGVQQYLACRGASRPEPWVEALKWVRLSAAQGYRGAERACEFVALGMTREQVAEAGRRVTAFVAG